MSPETYIDEEIDLRAIVQGLFKYKWMIIAVTVVLALAGYLVSTFLLEKEYNSTAYVVIVKPSTTVNLDAGIESLPQLPDAKSLTDLTMADDLVESVLQDPQVANLFTEPTNRNALRSKLESTLVGGNQMRLEVVDTAPERAAVIANVWAREITLRFNSLFGSGGTELEQTQAQAEQARLDWDTAEQALLEHLAKSDQEAWKIGLDQQKQALAELVLKTEQIDLLISDVKSLQARLEDQAYRDSLSLEDALSLIMLSQQASGRVNNLQLQLNSETIPAQETTVGSAREDVATLISALEQQKAELLEAVSDKSDLITYLAARYESARYATDQLTLQRDLNRQAYDALSSHVIEIQIMSGAKDQIAKIAGEALPP
ncbi:MAG: hypothetical protein JW726_20440, partial [Anaerolineales bacterium]|nr:hypothetical protein [Anaerolineales bacterium]